MRHFCKYIVTAFCVAVLTACGGGSDPFYSGPPPSSQQPPPSSGGQPTPPVSNVPAPIARAPLQAPSAPTPKAPAGPKVLVVYDAPPGIPLTNLGKGYAILIGNLLGHFDADVKLMPVDQYKSGQMLQYHATFYVGSNADVTLPQSFLMDAAYPSSRLIWMRYNIWQIDWNIDWGEFGGGLSQQFGFRYDHVADFDQEPSDAQPEPGFFNTIHYKNLAYPKFYQYEHGMALAAPEAVVTSITQPSRASVRAVMSNTKTGESAPYIVQSGKFWYVADIPVNFMGPRDRYLVFADLLHDMLDIDHPTEHRAMIRLEDIDARVDYKAFTTTVHYLHQKGIPFSMAVVPRYRDAYGIYNNGVPQEIPLAEATTLRAALDYALARGGEIVQHGYTHQAGTYRNPDGITGLDFEFWDIMNDRPLAEDSVDWARGRILAGRQEFLDMGYMPQTWETPHYQGSAASSRAAAQIWGTTFARMQYYTADNPNLTSGAIERDFSLSQEFPYIIERDLYGQRVFPENLGNPQYLNYGSATRYTWQDIVLNAKYAMSVRDGFGAFFFHPFLLIDPNGSGYSDLTNLVEGISQLRYTWTTPSRLIK